MLGLGVTLQAACQTEGAAPTWSETQRDAVVASLEAGRCAEAWQLLWPYAVTGNGEPSLILGIAMYAHGLTPPGAGGDALSLARSTISVYAQAARTGDAHATEMFGSLLGAEFLSRGIAKDYTSCLEQGHEPGMCVDNVLAEGIFPPFEQWAKEVDALSRAPRTEAKCVRPPADRLPSSEDGIAPQAESQ